MRWLWRLDGQIDAFLRQGERLDPNDKGMIVQLATGLTRLQNWYENYEIVPPQWMHSLIKTIESRELLTTNNDELLRKVLLPGWTKGYESWAVGTWTDSDPFEV